MREELKVSMVTVMQGLYLDHNDGVPIAFNRFIIYSLKEEIHIKEQGIWLGLGLGYL